MKYITKEDSFLRSKCMTLLIKSGLKINIKYKIDTIKNMIDVNNDGYPLVKYLINNNADEDNNLKPQTIPKYNKPEDDNLILNYHHLQLFDWIL